MRAPSQLNGKTRTSFRFVSRHLRCRQALLDSAVSAANLPVQLPRKVNPKRTDRVLATMSSDVEDTSSVGRQSSTETDSSTSSLTDESTVSAEEKPERHSDSSSAEMSSSSSDSAVSAASSSCAAATEGQSQKTDRVPSINSDPDTSGSIASAEQASPSSLKVFACPFKGCKSAFHRSSMLQRHKRTRTGEKRFACRYCEYRCSRLQIISKSMNRHMQALKTGSTTFVARAARGLLDLTALDVTSSKRIMGSTLSNLEHVTETPASTAAESPTS